jgi:hypothetical protein
MGASEIQGTAVYEVTPTGYKYSERPAYIAGLLYSQSLFIQAKTLAC